MSVGSEGASLIKTDDDDDVKKESTTANSKDVSQNGQAHKIEPEMLEEIKCTLKEEPASEEKPSIDVEERQDDEVDENSNVEESEESVEVTHLDRSLLFQDPAYAELCSFFNMFSSLLSMKPISFSKLEKIFCTLYNDEVDRELIDLHVTLMRKIYLKFARADKWESALQKFCAICPALESEAVKLQRCNYSDLSLSIRLTILLALCESQFDCNVKFKENVFNTYQTNELRLAPIGFDKNGFSYFYQQDCDLNIRVYTEEPDDMSGGTWTLKAKSEKELLYLIDALRSPDFGKKTEVKEDDEEIDEDQLLDSNSKTGDLKTRDSASVADEKVKEEEKPLPVVELTEAEQSEISTYNKRFTFVDLFRNASLLNKKKLAKEDKKKEKETLKTTSTSKKDEEVEEEKEKEEEKEEDVVDEETLIALEEEERRVLPRRSAKSNAISNLKTFCAKKSSTTPSAKIVKEKSKLPCFVETLPNSSEEFDSAEDDEEEEDANSSDDDFTLGDNDKPQSSFTNTINLAKKKKKPIRRRPLARPPASSLVPRSGRKQKQPEITFVSSDEDEEVVEEELKQRKKATEKTLCMQCRSSKRPDLLLLCDMCDDAWHTWCLKPQLWYVPDGDWFCPKCHHQMLVKKLSLALIKLQEALKVKQTEDKKKQAAADRLKREMEYIGISLNNVIPSNAASKNSDASSSSSEADDENMRKSKKLAMKKVLSNKMRKKLEERYYAPIITIAEGRSRRATTKVDYNFQAYDDQLQEAMELDASINTQEETPSSGLGRGKDMATIYEAERKRKASMDQGKEDDGEGEPAERLAGAHPPSKKLKKQAKKRHRLTDIDIDNITESSDSEEYKEDEDAVQSEDPEPSEDEYLPREFQKTRSGRRGGLTKSDDDFINDDDSSSEYEVSSSKRHKNQKHAKNQRGAKKGGRWGRRNLSDESSDASDNSSNLCSDSSSDGRKKRKGGRGAVAKRKSKASTSSEEEEDEEELEMPSASSGDEKTETGRPLRRAAVEMKKKIKIIEEGLNDDEVEDDGEEEVGEEETANNIVKDKRPVGALTRPVKPRKISGSDEDDEPEFKPPDDELEEEEETSDAEDNDDGDIQNDEKAENGEVRTGGEETKDAQTKNGTKNQTLTAKSNLPARRPRGKARQPTPPPLLPTKTRTRGAEKFPEKKSTEERSSESSANSAVVPKLSIEDATDPRKEKLTEENLLPSFAALSNSPIAENSKTNLSSKGELSNIDVIVPLAGVAKKPRRPRGFGLRKQASNSSVNSASSATGIAGGTGSPKTPISSSPAAVSTVPASSSSSLPVSSVPVSMPSTSLTTASVQPSSAQSTQFQQPSASTAATTSAPAPIEPKYQSMPPAQLHAPTSNPAQIFHHLPSSAPPHNLMPAPLPPHSQHMPLHSMYLGAPPPGMFYSLPQTGKGPPPPQAYLQHPPNSAAGPEYYAHHLQYSQPPPPQFIYQTMQPYAMMGALQPPPPDQPSQQMLIDPRTGQLIESDSLGHALAGAMNPEDL